MAEGVRIYPLHLADVRLPEDEPWPAGMPFPVVAHAIAHRDGVFLFDTGMGSGNAEVDDVYSPGLSYELLDGETVIAPGLRALPTPGHTAGHQSHSRSRPPRGRS